MIHTQPTMTTLEDMDLHAPPHVWPEYMLAPIPADERLWRSDNHYAAYLIRNPWGGVNPIAALAKEMAEVHWEAQFDRDTDSPSLTMVQARYRALYVAWRDAEHQRKRAMYGRATRTKRTRGRRA